MNFLRSFLNRNYRFFLGLLIVLSGFTAPTAGYAQEKNTKAAIEPIAVFPVENLSGVPAPSKQIRDLFIESLRSAGVVLLPESNLQRIMAKYRIRYTGGIDSAAAEALSQEGNVRAVLITNIDLYSDWNPPKIGVTARLVSTEKEPVILWMDSVGISGDDSPGILDVGLIEDPVILLEKALKSLTTSFRAYSKGLPWRTDIKDLPEKFKPAIKYRDESVEFSKSTHTIAVVPFYNCSIRKYAGETMALHFANQLSHCAQFSVLELGMIRDELLKQRILMRGGISLADASGLFTLLNCDIILAGEVFDYQDYQGPSGTPRVDFSSYVITKDKGEMLWSSFSSNTGDDGVYFFDVGRVNTAHAMASHMTRSIIELMIQ